jgi:hypothetical protein
MEVSDPISGGGGRLSVWSECHEHALLAACESMLKRVHRVPRLGEIFFQKLELTWGLGEFNHDGDNGITLTE